MSLYVVLPDDDENLTDDLKMARDLAYELNEPPDCHATFRVYELTEVPEEEQS